MALPLLIFVAALAGGALLWLIRWDDRRLHLALSLSTGTFLGAVFLHLLPGLAERAGGDEGAGGHGDIVWLLVLAGVLLVHLVEAVWLRTTEHDDQRRHENIGLVTSVGISAHAASAGLGLAALEMSDALGTPFTTAFLVHKAFESFAVVNVLMLAHMARGRIVSALVVFALVTPVFLLLGDQLLGNAGHEVLQWVTAVATGTFLYVSVAELLPEVFHHRGDNLLKTLGLTAGIALSLSFEMLGM